jgi:hypothetical protein
MGLPNLALCGIGVALNDFDIILLLCFSLIYEGMKNKEAMGKPPHSRASGGLESKKRHCKTQCL